MIRSIFIYIINIRTPSVSRCIIRMTDAADYDDATFSECHYFICESYAQANPLRCVSGSRLDARDFLSPFPKVVSLSMPETES